MPAFKEFPELGPLDDAELERQGLCLFASPRAAKRQCGRSQRVIKVLILALAHQQLSARPRHHTAALDGTLIAPTAERSSFTPLIETIALIGKQNGGACSTTDHADHQSNPHQKTGGQGTERCPPS